MYRFRLAIELRFFPSQKSNKTEIKENSQFLFYFFFLPSSLYFHDTKSKRHQFKWQEKENKNYFEMKALCAGFTLAQTGRDLNILIGIREKSYD